MGDYQIKEIRETELVYGLKPKNLIEHGYGHLDSLMKNDFIVTYPTDSDNNFEVANTETAMKDLEANTFQSNYDWLADSYSNGTFSNL